jgi:hypothetical protein
MSSFNLNGMVSFVGGKWEVVGPFVAVAVNLSDSTLCLKGSMYSI